MKKLISKIIFPLLLIPSIALATNNDPMQVVQAWAKAVKARDGKKQYQLLCPEQQAQNRASLESTNWVTGVSSPQIGEFKIEKMKESKMQKRPAVIFSVKYQIILSGHPVGTVSDRLQVKNGCIAQFNYLSPSNVYPSR